MSYNNLRTFSRFFSLNSKYKKVTHVIFDMDGLLLDTEGIYKQVIFEIAASHGKLYTPSVRAKILGTQEVDTCKIAVREMQLPISWEQFQEEFKAKTHIMLQNCPLMKGAEKYVRHLHANNVPIAVATSSSSTSFANKTRHHGEFFSMFQHCVTGASDPDVRSGKPSPDIFLVCARRFLDKPTSADQCLVMEDAPNGVTAAITAGMQCVVVPDKETELAILSHATLIVHSLEELQPEQFGLPAYKS